LWSSSESPSRDRRAAILGVAIALERVTKGAVRFLALVALP
jgi:hypothetical protein